jgi:hypothetical protein
LGKNEKLIALFKARPRDFTWAELVRLMGYLGYELMETGITGGSKRKFVNAKKHIISLHEPHPQKTLLPYMFKIVIENLGDKLI